MSPGNVRFGHAVTLESADDTLEAAIANVVEILLSKRPLRARAPRQGSVVFLAERILGVERDDTQPLYAYVGDLHPDLGAIGLVIARGWDADGALSGITKCDSGGLAGGLGGFAAIGDDAQRADALLALSYPSEAPLNLWPRDFAKEVEGGWHASPEDYVRGAPPRENTAHWDARRRVDFRTRESDRRTWTWEARFRSPPRASDYTHLVLSVQGHIALELSRRATGEEPPEHVRVIHPTTSSDGHHFAIERTRAALGGPE